MTYEIPCILAHTADRRHLAYANRKRLTGEQALALAYEAIIAGRELLAPTKVPTVEVRLVNNTSFAGAYHCDPDGFAVAQIRFSAAYYYTVGTVLHEVAHHLERCQNGERRDRRGIIWHDEAFVEWLDWLVAWYYGRRK